MSMKKENTTAISHVLSSTAGRFVNRMFNTNPSVMASIVTATNLNFLAEHTDATTEHGKFLRLISASSVRGAVSDTVDYISSYITANEVSADSDIHAAIMQEIEGALKEGAALSTSSLSAVTEGTVRFSTQDTKGVVTTVKPTADNAIPLGTLTPTAVLTCPRCNKDMKDAKLIKFDVKIANSIGANDVWEYAKVCSSCIGELNALVNEARIAAEVEAAKQARLNDLADAEAELRESEKNLAATEAALTKVPAAFKEVAEAKANEVRYSVQNLRAKVGQLMDLATRPAAAPAPAKIERLLTKKERKAAAKAKARG